MSKIGIVTKFEIIRQLKKPSFWIAVLLLPILLGGVIGLSILSSSSMDDEISDKNSKTDDTVKVGLIDDAKVVNKDVVPANVSFVEDKEKSIEAVRTGELDELYVIRNDFVESKEVESYVRKKSDETSLFGGVTSGNILSILSTSAASRVDIKDVIILSNSVNVKTTTFDETGEEFNLLGKAIIPIAVLAIFYILICVFGNRMLMAVVEEKENRISEMILTAVSAKQLIIGKIIALILLGFLQMIIFLIPVIIAIFVYRDNPMVSGILGIIEFDPVAFIGNLALLVFSYFLFTGACTFVGSLMPTARDASQYIGIVIVGMVLPLMFIGTMMTSTPSLITYVLSYFPLSAPIAMMIRNAYGFLPWYEFIFGLIEIGIFSMLSIYLASRCFQKNAINFSVTRFSFKSRKRIKG